MYKSPDKFYPAYSTDILDSNKKNSRTIAAQEF